MSSKIPSYLPSVGRLLGFAATAVMRAASRQLSPHGLTMQNWVVLSALWRAQRLRESDLAEYCHMSLSAMSKLVDRMQSKRLVRRKRDPDDARRAIVELASRGRSKANLLHFYEDLNKDMLEGFSAAESRTLFSYLERIIRNAEASLER
jgi:DNA-binding MarR family transcriptional regulator